MYKVFVGALHPLAPLEIRPWVLLEINVFKQGFCFVSQTVSTVSDNLSDTSSIRSGD